VFLLAQISLVAVRKGRTGRREIPSSPNQLEPGADFDADETIAMMSPHALEEEGSSFRNCCYARFADIT